LVTRGKQACSVGGCRATGMIGCVEPHAHDGALEDQPHYRLLGQRAGAPRSQALLTSRRTRFTGVGRGSRLNRSSYPEAERVELDIGMAPEADGRADELALVAPGTAADDTKAWIPAPEPR
jgi:hypothetical protein